MKKSELQKLIREEVRKVLKESSAQTGDAAKIESFLLASPQFEDASPSEIKMATKYLFDEWKNVAGNYKNIFEYLDELENTGGLEGLFEVDDTPVASKKPVYDKIKKSLQTSLEKKFPGIQVVEVFHSRTAGSVAAISLKNHKEDDVQEFLEDNGFYSEINDASGNYLAKIKDTYPDFRYGNRVLTLSLNVPGLN
jgi:hypothetical protein